MDNEKGLHRLHERTFDEIFEATVADHPDASSEEIEVMVNAKMQIRQSYVNEQDRRNTDREEAMKIPITDELFRGWKAFQIQEGHLLHNERSDFDQVIQYLLARHPHKLIHIHVFWLEALKDPIAAHARLQREHEVLFQEVDRRLKKSLEGEIGRQMSRFVDVMSKRRDGKSSKE